MALSWINGHSGGITWFQITTVMDKLPKILVTTLTELCTEQEIISWNIGAKGDIVNVNIRFAEHGHAMNMQGSSSGGTYMTGMRGKSPGQIRRDQNRFNIYRRNTMPKLDLSFNGMENETNEEQDISQRQVCEPKPFSPGTITSINSPAIPVEMEQSPDHEDQGHVQSSNHVTKTKTKTKAKAHVGQKHEVDSCDDQGMDTLLSPDQSTGSHSTHTCTDTIDPSTHFCKIIADYRSVTHFTTLRGLTKSGEIACYVPNKKKHPFFVLYEYDMYEQYNPEYGRALEIMNRFDDQREEDYWKNDIQELCNHWMMYMKEMNVYGT